MIRLQTPKKRNRRLAAGNERIELTREEKEQSSGKTKQNEMKLNENQ